MRFTVFLRRDVMKKMMITIFISICIFILPVMGIACTAFMLDNSSQPVYGKNTDAVHTSCFVIVNKQGVSKTSRSVVQEPDAEHINWTSKFGSVTFNFVARELPSDGINESGLFISSLAICGRLHNTHTRNLMHDHRLTPFN